MKYRVFRRVAHEKGQWVYDTKHPLVTRKIQIRAWQDKGRQNERVFGVAKFDQIAIRELTRLCRRQNVFVMVEFTDLIGDCWLKGSPKPSEPSGMAARLWR